MSDRIHKKASKRDLHCWHLIPWTKTSTTTFSAHTAQQHSIIFFARRRRSVDSARCAQLDLALRLTPLPPSPAMRSRACDMCMARLMPLNARVASAELFETIWYGVLEDTGTMDAEQSLYECVSWLHARRTRQVFCNVAGVGCPSRPPCVGQLHPQTLAASGKSPALSKQTFDTRDEMPVPRLVAYFGCYISRQSAGWPAHYLLLGSKLFRVRSLPWKTPAYRS